MDAFASSLRLPEGALPPPSGSGASDDVFVRLMGLHKGRTLLARALRRATPTFILPSPTQCAQLICLRCGVFCTQCFVCWDVPVKSCLAAPFACYTFQTQL